MKQFKIRASAVGKLMTGTIGLTEGQKSKMDALIERRDDSSQKPLTANMDKELEGLIERHENPVLPQTVKSYCETWVKEQLYEMKYEFESKYTSKGNDVEDLSMQYYSKEKGLFLLKNLDTYEDDYFTGTPDNDEGDIVYDFKSSWSPFTFPLFDDATNPDYIGQAQVYMHLLNIKKGKVVHVLTETPLHLLKPWEEPQDYSHIDPSLRIKEFDVEYDPEFIEEAKKRVLLARKYIETLIQKL